MIEVIVFDLGGVILPFDHKNIAIGLSRYTRNPSFSPEKIFDLLFDKEKGLINPYEKGLLSTIEFFEMVKKELDLSIDFDSFKNIWNPIFREDEGTIRIILSLKNTKIPLFLLSNTNELHFFYVKEKFPVVHLFDQWILSYEIGAKKPERKIFEAIFERTDVESDKILYIDDIKEYVEVAEKMGIRGFHFQKAFLLKEFLKKEGILR